MMMNLINADEISDLQRRSQSRKSDEARPGGRAKFSENHKFLMNFSDE